MNMNRKERNIEELAINTFVAGQYQWSEGSYDDGDGNCRQPLLEGTCHVRRRRSALWAFSWVL